MAQPAYQANKPASTSTFAFPITTPKPTHISFQHTRSEPDEKMRRIYENATNAKAHLDMQPNPACSSLPVASYYGNRRGYLSECRCEVLNRITHPTIRHNYENQVINTILNLLKNQYKASFHFKLAIFSSGGLLAEQILLFRLFHKLEEKSFKGKIELFLIDKCYQSAIQNEAQIVSSAGKCIEQFVTENSQCLPKSVTIKTTFFDDAGNYIQLAKTNNDFKHHLLIGTDTEQSDSMMEKIGTAVGSGLAKPIVLIRSKVHSTPTNAEIPQLCSLGQPVDSRNPTLLKKTNIQKVIMAAVVALGIGVMTYRVYGQHQALKQSLLRTNTIN